MAANSGKRKRITVDCSKIDTGVATHGSDSSDIDVLEIFRRHFETQFEPLPIIKKTKHVVQEEEADEAEEESEWDGISETEETAVQVVRHTDAQSRMASMSKEELKVFMSSKPPKIGPEIPLLRDKVGATTDDDTSEAANLKKDLALQRLLSESHLLESSTNPTLHGNNRHKATDMRLQALGSKVSIFKQERMPTSHRQGIISKQNERESTRRQQAKENGIILEKAKIGAKKGSDGKRDRGVGAPGVGKFSGGTLKLSKKDILDIEGPKRRTSGRGGRGGARGGKKRGSFAVP